MTRQQRIAVRQMLASSPLDLGGDVQVQRPLFEQMLTAHPVPDDVRVDPVDLDGVAALAVTVGRTPARGTVLFFHGGGFALGSARGSVGLVQEIARRTGARVLTVDYRLAPEHPAPAAHDDAVRAYRALLALGTPAAEVVVGGESAGGGIALGMLASLADADLPAPAAVVLMSPWIDLTLSGPSMAGKHGIDPVVTQRALGRRVTDCAGDRDPADPAVSPLFAELRGLPPVLVQAGTHETLLDDAVRLAGSLAAADVDVVLDVTAEVTHVFQAFAAVLDEAAVALDRAARFIADRIGSVG